jgi:hypothetical protein
MPIKNTLSKTSEVTEVTRSRSFGAAHKFGSKQSPLDGATLETRPRLQAWLTASRWLLPTMLVLIVMIAAPACNAAELVLIRLAGSPTVEQNKLEVATQFYGLNFKVVTIDTESRARAIEALTPKDIVAVAIEANALPEMDRVALLRVLHRMPAGPAGKVPLLILGVTQQTDPNLLGIWSGKAVVGVSALRGSSSSDYVVGNVHGITQQLSGVALPFPGENAFYFTLGDQSHTQDILAVRSSEGVAPVFIRTDQDQQQVFLLCRTKIQRGLNNQAEHATNVVTAFAEVAPVMMFVKYVAGIYGWHSPSHYANFTIDDPWLREPYGNLSYKNLLVEMDKHNFHTTIAFIPWNYDRSEAEVVSLFRNHPDRYSICVHGNNHDHKEFDDLQSKPLSLQVADLRQAITRMEEFKKLTKIPYDKVFVFPHSIGSEPILGKLKTYNFVATANSTNNPMGAVVPAEPFFSLRAVTTSFEDFPSIIRYPAGDPQRTALIAVNDFLDNPMLFYAHQDFFASGINAFDDVADEVNRRDPGTKWRSLGELAAHLYLVRERSDLNYDVLALSSSFRLENTSGRNLTYYVEKREPDPAVIETVAVDGQDVQFKLGDGFVKLAVSVRAGGTRSVVVKYRNDLDLVSTSPSRRSLIVYCLRWASDFRDIWLSGSKPGRALTTFYYEHDGTPTKVVVCACASIAFFGAGWTLLVALRRRKTGSVGDARSPGESSSKTVRINIPIAGSSATVHHAMDDPEVEPVDRSDARHARR